MLHVEQTQKKLQVAVKAFIINEEGNILLLEKNKENRPEYPSKWDIPGGRIDVGVSLLDSLKREIKEETGQEIIGIPRLIFAQDILRETFHIVRLSYVIQTKGEFMLSEEHVSARWFSYDDLSNEGSVDECIREVLDWVPRETFVI